MAETQPWEANACFTIRAESREAVIEIQNKLAAYARRIGAGQMFSDYEGRCSHGPSNDGPIPNDRPGDPEPQNGG